MQMPRVQSLRDGEARPAAAPTPAPLRPAADEEGEVNAGPHAVPPPGPRYRRYHIDTADTPDLLRLPHRFRVEVRRWRLARLLLTEVGRYFGRWDTVLNRPCVYGVFGGPVGGFKPRQELCVGCLRCTVQHPDVVRIVRNPERRRLGDSYLTPERVETILYEAKAGNLPVRGQGYRGRFGGTGFDGMWTDMSEIVRPTRDGIHGRETISTVVELGGACDHLEFAPDGALLTPQPPAATLELPLLLDLPPDSLAASALPAIWARAAGELGTLAVLPLAGVLAAGLAGPAVMPLVAPAEVAALAALPAPPRALALAGWDRDAFRALTEGYPEAVVAVRLPFAAGWQATLLAAVAAGASTFHLEADYHGRGADGEFVLDLLLAAHRLLLAEGLRDRVTLIGSGGIVAAEHVPKAILAGLDAVALDTPLLAALQAFPEGEARDRAGARFGLPPGLGPEWAVQRVKNLAAAWRDQLLEILGAMGLREVRRLRGELGRAMFQAELEAEAFGDVEGFAPRGAER
jgi:Conserved region in glutamate synthase